MITNRPVWAEIDLEAIKHNVREIRKIVGDKRIIMPIVKANGYGHGDIEVSKACLESGAERVAVATLEEAVHLRNEEIVAPILVLGWTRPEDYHIAIKEQITLTLFDLDEVIVLNDVARGLSQKAIIHLKVDTGMGRLGIVVKNENLKTAANILNLPYLDVEGIYTHFAMADEQDKTYSRMQLKKFLDFTTEIEEMANKKIPIKHAANSAAIVDFAEGHLDLVRPGIIMYGLSPIKDISLDKLNLKPPFTLKATISRVAKFPEGTKISYGGIFTAKREIIVATVPIGYADGYTRALSGKAKVLVKDTVCPVIGRICMDQCMVDVTDIPDVKVGDEVILIGKGINNQITIDEIADMLGSINHEVICMLSPRIPRKYI
ncbi:alanine racemase [Desulfonispora thiosulfatigenes]|nr:alanine racemase [Desulfonispora thiosulfatigenes]